jgi:hypothetical protein
MAGTVADVLAELRAMVKERGLQLQDLDRRLDWPLNRTSKVFRGVHRVRLHEIFDILSAANLEPRQLWQRLAGGPDDPATRELLELLDQAELLKQQIRGEPTGSRGG